MAALVCTAVIGCYAWIVSPAVSQLGGGDRREAYYNLLVDGFRSGHLSLSRQPAPELATLADPYDPRQNRPYQLHDASYFRGKFYLYFGVTPALVLFWPYLIATGQYLWHSEAAAFFCAAGFLAAAGVLLGWRRRYFPTTGAGIMAALILTVGMATTAPALLRRPDVWEVPIACAYALAMLSLAALWRSLRSERRAASWLALASLSFGLAVGARPVVMFGGAMLLVPLLRICRQKGRAAWREGSAWRLLAAAVLPMALIGIGLACYNVARFGNPLEFGQTYQLADDKLSQLRFFSARYLWFNFRLYFLEPLRWSSYFPFVLGIKVPPPPPGQFGTENPFGVLTNLPVTWLALAAPLAWWRRPAAEADPLRWFTTAVALLFVLSAFTVCLFGGACCRYEMDFSPALALLAAVGILGLERRAAAWAGGWRWLTRLGWGGLLAWSVAGSFFASCQFGNLLHRDDPAAFKRLASVFDYPSYAVEKLRGIKPGPLEIKFRLPAYAGVRNEPILVTGAHPEVDYLFLNYRDESHLVIGLEHTGHGGPHSEPIPVDYAREHTLVIDAGPVYPPPGHPFFAGQDEFEVMARANSLRLTFDGKVVMDRMFPFYEASPQTRFIRPQPRRGGAGGALHWNDPFGPDAADHSAVFPRPVRPLGDEAAFSPGGAGRTAAAAGGDGRDGPRRPALRPDAARRQAGVRTGPLGRRRFGRPAAGRRDGRGACCGRAHGLVLFERAETRTESAGAPVERDRGRTRSPGGGGRFLSHAHAASVRRL